MPDAKELNSESSSGPSGTGEGPSEIKASPYIVDTEGGRPTRKWAMTIDLDRCTGCHACETACAAENNIPVVGEQQAYQGRLHQWIRVERYWEGNLSKCQSPLYAHPLPALRQCALRAGLPGLRHLPQPGRHQCDGLQPLRRDALLRQQLSL